MKQCGYWCFSGVDIVGISYHVARWPMCALPVCSFDRVLFLVCNCGFLISLYSGVCFLKGRSHILSHHGLAFIVAICARNRDCRGICYFFPFDQNDIFCHYQCFLRKVICREVADSTVSLDSGMCDLFCFFLFSRL